MALRYHQISLKETFSNCQDFFIDDTPSFFQLSKILRGRDLTNFPLRITPNSVVVF